MTTRSSTLIFQTSKHVRIIASTKEDIYDQGMVFTFIGYAQNYIGSIYHMLNLFTKCNVISRDTIWKKTYGKYVSIWEHTKAGSYILKDEDKSDKWYYLKMYPSNIEDINIEKLLRPIRILGGKKT